MASRRGAHLDFIPNRQIGYCHECASEWYREIDDPLICPECTSSFVQIVSGPTTPLARTGLEKTAEDEIY